MAWGNFINLVGLCLTDLVSESETEDHARFVDVCVRNAQEELGDPSEVDITIIVEQIRDYRYGHQVEQDFRGGGVQDVETHKAVAKMYAELFFRFVALQRDLSAAGVMETYKFRLEDGLVENPVEAVKIFNGYVSQLGKNYAGFLMQEPSQPVANYVKGVRMLAPH